MSEIFILHLDNADEDLYTKILKVINESGAGDFCSLDIHRQ